MAEDFEKVFKRLKPILQTFESNLTVKFNEPGKYYLISNKPFNKRELWFGGVEIKKNYVSFHLVPLYMFPELLDDISPELKKRMQGKACFNFKNADDKIFADLANLTSKSFEFLRQKEII